MRRQDVAHVVIDLGNGKAELGKALLLLQGSLQFALHTRQMLTGDRQFVLAFRRHQHALGARRLARKFLHALGHRLIGRISMRLMARKISAAVISEMAIDRRKTLRE